MKRTGVLCFVGPLMGGTCRLSVLRNANVAVAYLLPCPLSKLRSVHGACHITKSPCRMSN